MVMNLGLNPLTSPEARDNPYPFFAMARQMMPVLRLEQFGVWSAFLYEDCRNILRDSKRFSSSFIRRMPEGQARPRPSMLNSDPPRHTRLRELVNKAFTPRMVAQLECDQQLLSILADRTSEIGRVFGNSYVMRHGSYPR